MLRLALVGLVFGLLSVGCGSLVAPESSGSVLGARNAPVTVEQSHTVTKLNAYRAGLGAGPLTLDTAISVFALAGDQALASGGSPHAHFIGAGDEVFAAGFCGQAAENQAPGWNGADSLTLIDEALQAMMDEGPGGGHYDNIVNPALTRVGVAVITNGQGLFFTNDFSGPCG